MLDFQLDVQPQTIRQIETIADFYPNAEVFYQDVIDREISELERGNFYMRLDIQKYEEQYEMTNETFYAKFLSGEADDREDFMIWSGLYEFVLQNEAKLAKLAELA